MPRGSLPGERRGGRQRGTPNKATALRNAAIFNAAADPNFSPLDFLLALMRDTHLPLDLRVTVAQAALPFVHSKPKDRRPDGPVRKKYGAPVRSVNVAKEADTGTTETAKASAAAPEGGSQSGFGDAAGFLVRPDEGSRNTASSSYQGS